MRDAIGRASRAAGVPVYSPHDLRSPRQSVARTGMPARELAERMGHTNASMSLDVYTQVMPPDEIAQRRSYPYSRTRGGENDDDDRDCPQPA
jgi:integrase